MSIILLFQPQGGVVVDLPVSTSEPVEVVNQDVQVSGHLKLLQALLPPVSYAPNAPNLLAELTAEANVFDAIQASAQTLLSCIVPNAGPSLEDWERVYATPSPCQVNIGLTRAQRVSAVKAKINGGGTFNKTKAIELAAEFGYTITIKEHRARTFGKALMGGNYGDRDWNFVWDIQTQDNNITSRTCGNSFGEPYATWGNELLECLLRPKAITDTLVRFIYY